ncbi:MAG: hypothetical protein J0H17_10410 [Rhizobiales bacterium]|nr:hypothetical protein [Hyphomicrobiales bacterium]
MGHFEIRFDWRNGRFLYVIRAEGRQLAADAEDRDEGIKYERKNGS